jgi:hypothetical protein
MQIVLIPCQSQDFEDYGLDILIGNLASLVFPALFNWEILPLKEAYSIYLLLLLLFKYFFKEKYILDILAKVFESLMDNKFSYEFLL